MSKCYVVTLTTHKGYNHEAVFLHYPSYRTLVNRAPIWGKKILAECQESVKFSFSISVCGFSSPLFKNNPTGKEQWQKDFPHKKNHVGGLAIYERKFFSKP